MFLILHTLLTLITAVVVAVTITRDDSHIIHEKRGILAAEWTKGEKVDAHWIVPVRIGLTQRNLDIGPDLLYEISDPDSLRYGKHYTYEEVIELFAPSSNTVQAVQKWIESEGFPTQNISLSANKQWLQFDARMEDLERILKTEFYFHKHVPSGRYHPACDEYYVPKSIQHHIDYITPGIKLPETFSPKRSLSKRLAATSQDEEKSRLPVISEPLPGNLSEVLAAPLAQKCGHTITPACIRALYNISIGTTAYPGNELGIFESLAEYYRQEDFDRFFTKFFPQIPNGTHPIPIAIDGGRQFPNEPAESDGVESQLDFDLAMPIVYPQKTEVYQSGDGYSEIEYPGIFNTFLDAIDGSYCSYCAYGECGDLKGEDPPFPDPHKGGYKGKLQCGKYKATNVISVSYGGSEFYTPMKYQRRMCNEWMKLGMQGISIVVASGDSGYASDHPALDDGCLWAHQDNHNFTESFNKPVANPGTPQSCPWVTVVGATRLPKGADVYKDAEVTTDTFISGAGFSNIFARPKYQNAAVEKYFTLYKPPFKSYNSVLNNSFAAGGGLYNRIGRAYPDVSANGQNIILSVANRFSLFGGTSASAPIWASILTRINEERLSTKKSTIGFINPVLYKYPEMFHDLTKGSNSGCVNIIFNATKGWDPVYGLGTPDFPKLRDLFLGLP